jgi:hypothetical protein
MRNVDNEAAHLYSLLDEDEQGPLFTDASLLDWFNELVQEVKQGEKTVQEAARDYRNDNRNRR